MEELYPDILSKALETLGISGEQQKDMIDMLTFSFIAYL